MRTRVVDSASLFALPLLAMAAPDFNESNIRDTIKTLSSDAFGGRAPGSQGEQLTTD